MLSKESKSVLYVLYKQYLLNRKQGMSKRDAMSFDSSTAIQEKHFPEMISYDVDEAICELERNGYTQNFYADNIVYMFSLTDLAIVTMENQTADTLKSLIDFVSKFIS